MTSFVECESVNISYNIMGIASITYTIISKGSIPQVNSTFNAGVITFNGVITSIYSQPISNTEKADGGPWYTTNVTMVA